MNFFTHITFGRILWKRQKNTGIGNQLKFIYGNIEPDLLTLDCFRRPHTMENYMDHILELVGESGKDDRHDYVKYGQICHFVCDFFCKYHQEENIFKKWKDHFLYELLLHMKLLIMSLQRTKHRDMDTLTGSGSVYLLIHIMKSRYLQESPKPEHDISYALDTALHLCAFLMDTKQQSPAENIQSDPVEYAHSIHSY